MVYGPPLHLPTDLVVPTSTPSDPHPTSYIHKLRNIMESFRVVLTAHCRYSRIFIHPALPTSINVFVHKEAHCTPLQPRFDANVRVISRSFMFYILELHGRQESVSLDRLKLAFLEALNFPRGSSPAPRLSQPVSSRKPCVPQFTLNPSL